MGRNWGILKTVSNKEGMMPATTETAEDGGFAEKRDGFMLRHEDVIFHKSQRSLKRSKKLTPAALENG